MRHIIVPLATALLALSCARPSGQQIVFAPKAYYDSAETALGDVYVYVAGTLAGEGVFYKNNTVAVTCYKDQMECLIYSIDQIGANQLGRLDAPTTYPVAKWAKDEVVASDAADAVNCRKDTISIVRQSHTVVWVQEPINQSAAACKDADTRLLKWTIDDPPSWKALHERK